ARRQSKMHSRDIVPGGNGARRSHRGVDAAGHRGQDLHDFSTVSPVPSAQCRRSRPGSIHDRCDCRHKSVDVGCVRGVTQGEAQRATCAVLVVPHCQQHVARPRTAGTSSVPDRTSRSCPPPCNTGTHSTSRPSNSTPAPIGPPNLCPVTVIASTPLDPKSTGIWPTACTASVWNGTPYSCAMATSSSIG